MLPAGVHIKENSWRAKVACKVMKSNGVAIVFGKTIHLYGITEAEFLSSKTLVKHELKHVEQYQHNGYFGFLIKYLWECMRHGYYNNRFEIEARQAENA